MPTLDEFAAPTLRITGGAGDGQLRALLGGRAVVGRAEECALSFNDGKLSREHAEFVRGDDGWRVRDLGSRNGTSVNGKAIGGDGVLLTPGDRVTTGLLELELLAPAQAPARLRVLDGRAAGREFALGEGELVLGRSTAEGVRGVDDQAASRRNTAIVRDGDGWRVRDLESRNGTDVDGERLPAGRSLRLRSGARLRVGATTLLFLDPRIEAREGAELLGWTIRARAGGGLAGTLWEARHRDGREGVLRLLDPARLPDAAARLRTLNAARAQGRIAHPHVAAIHTAELAGSDGVVVGEWAAGGTLMAQLLLAQPLPAERVWRLMRDAAFGLQAAEEKGLVHRALRPGSILIDGQGGALVGDFGVGVRWDAADPYAGGLPHWISPEEVEGAEPDARSTQFTLGCIAWHALTARWPWGAPDRGEVARQRLTAPLPAPEIGRDGQRVLARLLARAPGDRYASWAEAAADLAALAKGATPATGALPAERTALEVDAARAARPAPLPRHDESGMNGPTVRRAPTHHDRVTVPPMALKLLVGLAAVLVIGGFLLPALSRSNRAPVPSETAPPVATTTTTSARTTPRYESPSEMIARINAEIERNKAAELLAAPAPAPEPAAPDLAAAPAPAARPETIAAPVQPEPAVQPAPEAVAVAPAPASEPAVPATGKTTPEAAPVVASAERPSSPDITTGDIRFRAHRFAEAATAYKAALARHPGNAWLEQRVAETERLAAVVEGARAAVPSAIADGDHLAVLEQSAAFVEVMAASRLEPAWKEGIERAWAAQAGHATPDQRTRWQTVLGKAGVKLTYDENAPALLAEAVAAARAAKPARDQVRLFAKAAKANAPFGEEEDILYARALADTGDSKGATERVARLPAAARSRPEVSALLLDLGLKAPELNPQIVACFAVGGAGNQYIREVGFEGGVAYARGTGFGVLVDPRTGKASVQGDPATPDTAEWKAGFSRSPKAHVELKDPRNDQTYSITTLQVHPILQQPLLKSSAGWKLWGWNHQQVAEGTKGVRWGPLMADSRGYDVWLMPEGRIGVLCWTDGGNSVLTRDPRDLNKANDAVEQGGSFRTSAGGMSTLFLLVDPKDGTPLSGTFVRSHVTNRAVDAFGRVYLPKPMDGAAPLGGAGSDAGGGLFVLRPDLRQPELNVRIGAGGSDAGQEAFGSIAINDNLLILGGTTGSPKAPMLGGPQKAPGGGQDGFVCLIRLWEKR